MQKEQIRISKTSFELWFNTPLKTIKSDNLSEAKYVEKLYDIIHFIDANKETRYYKYIQEHFINTILVKNLFCILILTQVATFQVIKSCKSVKSIFSNSDLCTTNFRLVKGCGL
jgi:hypothetical protein